MCFELQVQRRMSGMSSAQNSIKVLDVVALTDDVAGRNLVRGQVGTVFEVLSRDVFEVEFADDAGRTYAQLPLSADQLLVLHYEPV
jgi:hypothetical protein